ncbi:MAG TPA: hypothetical protein GX499_03575 [Clostridiales bacterium]|nr:hypothetical protein [Clostridiales bacterium]
MPFKMFRVNSAAELDSAPVALIANYPLEKRDYKPYAQCNFCWNEEALFLRMWAFELTPPPGSRLTALLYLWEEQLQKALAVTMEPEEKCTLSLYENGAFQPVEPPEGFRLHPHSGEDLQGVYWGGLATLPKSWLEQWGRVPLQAGAVMRGNFFKLCPGPEMAHQGSAFPADFLGNPFDRESMEPFLVVSY